MNWLEKNIGVILIKHLKFKWELGRQETGYRKLLIASNYKTWDIYIIDYPVGTYIKPHTDPVSQGKHYRLNIILYGYGEFNGKTIYSLWNRIHLFRPDIVEHSVNNIKKRRVVLSIGYLKL